MTQTIEQLRQSIASARTSISRIEGQQESAASALAKVEAAVDDLGLDAENLMAEAAKILEDVELATKGVEEEIASLQEVAHA